MVIDVKVTSVLLLIVFSAFAFNAHAQQYYKWVDENGVTHYEEERPNQNIEHVALQFPDEYSVSNPEEDYYSIQNQLKRLQEWRAQQQAAKQKAQALAPQREVQIQEVYVQSHEPQRRYYLPRHYSRHTKGHHYKPAKPYCCNKPKVERPPARIVQKAQPRRSSSGLVASRYE